MADATPTSNLLIQLSDALTAAVERAGGGTVTVDARRRLPASGIIWDADGTIVTANHVVRRDEEITVGLPDGRTVAARLAGRDPGSDLAVLQVETADVQPAPRRTEPVGVGHLVLAVGRPAPGAPMASFGLVNAIGGPWRARGGDIVEGFIKAGVEMLPGFSGGPLVDGNGQVIGLNTSTLGGGVTLPVVAVERIVTSLKMHGRVRRGYLGVGTQAVQLPVGQRETLGLTQEHGLLLVNVEPQSPAEQGGLMLGDIIVALESDTVTDVDQLQAKLTGDRVGKALPVRVIRGGVSTELEVTVGERT